VVAESGLGLFDVSVRVELSAVRGIRIEKGVSGSGISGPAGGPVKFDVSARLEEKERRSGRIVIFFGLVMGTKPSVVKFELEGYATLLGRDEALGKMLEVDPRTSVPFVFHRVYQHSFLAIYVLATLMGTIYPPPDLLFSAEGHIGTGSTETKKEQEENQPRESVQSPNQVTADAKSQKQ